MIASNNPISQQDLIRAVSAANNWSREQMCEVLNLSKRALDSWVLPNSSKGFRRMPSETWAIFESVLFDRETSSRNISSPQPVGDGLDIVCDATDNHLLFPRPVWHAVTGPEYRETPCEDGVGSVVELIPGTSCTSGYISLDAEHHFSLLDEQTITSNVLAKPSLIDGQPYWTTVTHHRSHAHAHGFMDALDEQATLAGGDIEELMFGLCSYSLRQIGGEFFTITTLPAPPWHPFPLFRFATKCLIKSHVFGIVATTWERCVTSEGLILEATPCDPCNL